MTASRMGFPRSPRWCRGTGGSPLSDCQLTLLEAQPETAKSLGLMCSFRERQSRWSPAGEDGVWCHL